MLSLYPRVTNCQRRCFQEVGSGKTESVLEVVGSAVPGTTCLACCDTSDRRGRRKDTSWLVCRIQRIPESWFPGLALAISFVFSLSQWVCHVPRASGTFPLPKKLPYNSVRSKNNTSFFLCSAHLLPEELGALIRNSA